MFNLTLTFDNGPEPNVTPFVLDALRERGIKATFFAIGQKVAAYPDIVARARQDGHWIGNHTWSHTTPLGDLPETDEAADEIEKAQHAIMEFTHSARFFRPFGHGETGPHLLNRQAAKHLIDGAYTCILWNIMGHEWDNPSAGWVEPTVAECTSLSWPVLVLHDQYAEAMRHLPRFLDRLLEEGAVFRMEFPPSCVLIDRGRPTQALSPYVAGGWNDIGP